MSDLTIAFYWYLVLALLGTGFLPFSSLLFRRFQDCGYGFTKVIGLLVLGYSVWLGSSLKVLNFQSIGIWILPVAFAPWIITYYYRPGYLKEMAGLFGRKWKIWLCEELIFLAGLLGWAWIRSFQPNIEGLEKFMDFGFVNSILRSRFMPPQDMWLTGYTINYYYFGHFLAAFLTKISGLASQYTYNLMMATVLAFSLSAAFSFGYNLIHIIIAGSNEKLSILGGMLSALLVNLAGNLHTIVFAFQKGTAYWYPDATRFIGYNPPVADKTIHEFPMYSYVVADLHGHMISIPHVILTLAVIFYFINFILNHKNRTLAYGYAAFLAFLLAILFMTNTWDFPIYFGVFGVSLVIYSLFFVKNSSQKVFNILFYPLFIIMLWFVLTLPYQLNFSNFAKGIGTTWSHSRFYQLAILWGMFWWFAISYVLGQSTKFIFIAAKKWKRVFSFPFLFPLVMILFSFALITAPELIYLKDIYIKEHYRANTMFKLGYQAYIMFSLIAALTMVYALSVKAKNRAFKLIRIGWLFVSTALIASVMIYPYYAVRGYYGNLTKRSSLDGWLYLRQQYPGDLAAIRWFKENVTGQPVVLEAVGDSYTTYARISANTGLPTVLGWPVHEWLWRGSYDIPGARTAEVQQAYTSNSAEQLKHFMMKYKIEYIIVGQKEKDKYPSLNENTIRAVSRLVFTDSGTSIYQYPWDGGRISRYNK